FRKHRYDTVHQVDRGTAFKCLFVEWRIGADKVGHIRDVDPDFVMAVGKLLKGESVVKIFRVGWVNGKGSDGSEVTPFCNFFLRDGRWEGCRFLFYRLGKLQGKTEVGQDGVHLRVVFASLTQHMLYPTYRIFTILRPFGDGHDDLLAILGAVQVGQRYKYVVRHLPVVSNQESKAGRYVNGACKFRACPFQDFHDLTFLAFSTQIFIGMYLYAVAVQCLPQFPGGDIDIVLKFVFGHDESRAVRRHVHAADDEHF